MVLLLKLRSLVVMLLDYFMCHNTLNDPSETLGDKVAILRSNDVGTSAVRVFPAIKCCICCIEDS